MEILLKGVCLLLAVEFHTVTLFEERRLEHVSGAVSVEMAF
jgi:hypothetical protein